MRVEEKGRTTLPHPAGHTAIDIAQDLFGFLGCKYTLLARVQPLTHPPADRAALDLLIPQPVLIPEIALTHVQHLTLGHVKLQEISKGPFLELLSKSLWSFRCVNHLTWLGVTYKSAEDAPDPFFYVIDKDIK